MNLIRPGLLAFCLGTICGIATGADTLVSPPALGELERPGYRQCLYKANTRGEKSVCFSEEKNWQQQQMKLLYQRLWNRLDNEQRVQLEKSQAAWETFMEAETSFAASFYYPQGLDLEVSSNEIKWLVQRRQQLQRYLSVIE